MRAFLRRQGIIASVTSMGLGIGLGLVIPWLILPIEFKNAEPAALRAGLKDEYVRLISLAYQADGDLARAHRRLQTLELAQPAQTFTDLIEREIRSGQPSATQDALIHLAHALGWNLPYTALRPPPLPRGGTLITITVVATPIPRVTSFVLIEHAQLSCVDAPERAYLTFYVRDAAGKDLPNVAIEIRGKDNIETIYTGLKPERGIGYADYEAAPGTYAVTILNSQTETFSNLVIGAPPTNCKADRGQTPRGWKLVFQQK